MAPGSAESDFRQQGWIDTLGLKQFFSIFSVVPRETVSFDSLDLNVPVGFPSGNIEGLSETKLTVSLGTSHSVITLITF